MQGWRRGFLGIETIPSWLGEFEIEQFFRLSPAEIATVRVKMIAYRAQTALVMLLQRHLKKPEEARALIRELFVLRRISSPTLRPAH